MHLLASRAVDHLLPADNTIPSNQESMETAESILDF